eukprot:GILK01009964.1.p1 GENE.GILK01009964.1~~GILK01009964.1.p1  ORF type:complete len:202 (-),score=25.52 GILK01009964.1:40-645(-)
MRLRKQQTLVQQHVSCLLDCVAKFDGLTKKGRDLAQATSNRVLKLSYIKRENAGRLAFATEVLEEVRKKLVDDVNTSAGQLKSAFSDILRLFGRMRDAVAALQYTLDIVVNEPDDSNLSEPVFRTLTFPSIVQYSNEILEMYQQQVFLQGVLSEEIPVTSCEQSAELTSYVTAWQMSPYIDFPRIQFLSELLKFEIDMKIV